MGRQQGLKRFQGGRAAAKLQSPQVCIDQSLLKHPRWNTAQVRRDPERGLQSWLRPAKPEPETRNRLLKLVSNCETRNPKPTLKTIPSPGPIETRNSKPETRNRLWRLNFPRADQNPKPETRNRLLIVGFELQNPKPETDSESGFQSTKPETRNRQRKLVSSDETRNPKQTAKVGFNRRNTKPETRNRLESDFWVALRIGTRPSTHTTTGKTTMSSISPSRLREAPLKIDLALLLAMSHRTELHSRRCHGEASLLRHKGPQILDEHCG